MGPDTICQGKPFSSQPFWITRPQPRVRLEAGAEDPQRAEEQEWGQRSNGTHRAGDIQNCSICELKA